MPDTPITNKDDKKFSWPKFDAIRAIRVGLGTGAIFASIYIMADWMGGDWFSFLGAAFIELTVVQFLMDNQDA